MRQRLLTVLGFCAAAFAGALSFPSVAYANQAPAPAYCTPPNTIQEGQAIHAPPIQQNFTHAETCPGQYGDLWTDGPLYNASFTYYSSSLNFTIPSMTWIAQGQRVFTSAAAFSAPASATTYWWLSTSSLSFTQTLSNLAPDQYSVLEYTITTSSNGITSVTNPAMASEIIGGSLSLSAFPSGSCVQTGTGGVLTATGLPCGTGASGIASVAGTGNITAGTSSGAVTVSEVNNPTWTGVPTIAGGTTSGTLDFGSDATASLSRTGTNGFQFNSGSNPTVTAAGGFVSGSSTYGATSAAVNGGLSATTLTASGLGVGDCVQTTTGGLLTTASGACATPGISAVNGSGNITASTTSGTTTVGIVSAPTFSGAVGASQFNGSGAGLTSGSVPNAALVTAPLTNVAASSPLSSTGGTTPTISVVSSPAFSGTPTAAGFNATGAIVAGSGTAYIPAGPHLSASSSTTSGGLDMGGTSSHCLFDYGITTSSTFTSGCNTNVVGTLAATTLEGTGLTPGNCVQATTSGVLTTTSSGCGSATSIASVSGTSPIGASTVSGAATITCTTCVTGLTAGSNMSVGTGTTPSVSVSSSPTFSGQLAVDGNSAPAAGIALGTTTTAGTLTSGVNGSASDAFDFKTTNCSTNLVVMYHGASAKDTFGCNGSLVANSSISSTSSIVAGSGTVATVSAGDLAASRSASTGELHLGGSTLDCPIDFNISNTNAITINCGSGGLEVSQGAIYDSVGSVEAAVNVIAGAGNGIPSPIASGDLVATRSVSSGALELGGSQVLTGVGVLDYGVKTAGDFTFNKTLQVAHGSFLASYDGALANAPTLNVGDGGFSEGASSGQIVLGGSTSADTIDYGVTTASVETHSVSVSAPTLKDTGLSSSSVQTLCASNASNVVQCPVMKYFVTTGSTSKATGTTANTYQQFGASSLSITMGTSHATNNEWLVHVKFWITTGAGGLSAEDVYGCIAASVTIAPQNASTNGASTCQTTLTNSFAGGPPFGEQSSGGAAPLGLAEVIEADVLVANLGTLTITPYVAGNTTTSATVYGFCTMTADEY